MMNSLKPSSFLLIIATLVCCTSWRVVQCSTGMSLQELEEIEAFVRSVLAVARPYNLGISDRLPPRPGMPADMIDGPLPDDMQRYLEGLLSASLAVDRRSLVKMLLDDTLVVDEDQDPHHMFDRIHGARKLEAQIKKSVARMPKKTP